MVDWSPQSAMKDSRARVLVVEDDPDCLRLFVDALEYEGYEVVALRTNHSAHAVARSWMPDVVLCDLLLHGTLHSLALMDDLKNDPATAHISLILCSAAFEFIASELPRLQQHNISLLIKPFELYELSAVVADAVRVPRFREREYGA